MEEYLSICKQCKNNLNVEIEEWHFVGKPEKFDNNICKYRIDIMTGWSGKIVKCNMFKNKVVI